MKTKTYYYDNPKLLFWILLPILAGLTLKSIVFPAVLVIFGMGQRWWERIEVGPHTVKMKGYSGLRGTFTPNQLIIHTEENKITIEYDRKVFYATYMKKVLFRTAYKSKTFNDLKASLDEFSKMKSSVE
jgi:hypothetical protein